MANPENPRTRPALAEIPARMGPSQRVSGPFTRIAQNLPDGYLSPRMSPEEAVIQQRGRRRIPIIWSPEKGFYVSPNKTPTKSISAMTLRSSPRKRSLMKELSEVEPSGSEANTIASPSKRSPSAKSTSPSTAKKIRLEDGSINRKRNDIPLDTLLKGLSKEQLVTMINCMVQGNPRLEQNVRSELPMADIAPLEEQLNYQKKNIFKSLPASRLISKTDSPAYARAATHLCTFKKMLVDHSQTLHNSKHWDALLDYVMMAWEYVRATPVWDNPVHNAVRKHCFKILSYHAGFALKYGQTELGFDRLGKFQQKIKAMTEDCDDIQDCVVQLCYLLDKN